jgi:hypothetical protein
VCAHIKGCYYPLLGKTSALQQFELRTIAIAPSCKTLLLPRMCACAADYTTQVHVTTTFNVCLGVSTAPDKATCCVYCVS